MQFIPLAVEIFLAISVKCVDARIITTWSIVKISMIAFVSNKTGFLLGIFFTVRQNLLLHKFSIVTLILLLFSAKTLEKAKVIQWEASTGESQKKFPFLGFKRGGRLNYKISLFHDAFYFVKL